MAEMRGEYHAGVSALQTHTALVLLYGLSEARVMH